MNSAGKVAIVGHAKRLSVVFALLLPMWSLAADGKPTPLTDPIPEPIAKGDIVVAAIPFVRAPPSADPANPPMTNDAYARIQAMLPIPDGSGRLVFSDVRGFLYVTDLTGATPRMYLNLRTQDVDFYNVAFPNEAGLLGFAFHPQFGQPGKPGYGKLYTAFSAGPDSGEAAYLDESGENQESVIREWAAADPAAPAFEGTSREVLRVGQFEPTHNIGTIAFNPTASEGSPDYGLLYICFGDGGGRNDPRAYGQNLAVPLGGIARIDPLGGSDGRAYGIPADNPFVDTPGAAPELWAYGLRHPQHFSWDHDGRLFIGDIGQDHIEEVNLGVAGGNYGWQLREGTFATASGVGVLGDGEVYERPATDPVPFVYPVAQYDHDEGFAIAGGFVYRGQAIPQLRGKYVFADLARGRVFYIETEGLRSGQLATIKELRLQFDDEERDLVTVAGYANTYHGDEFPRVDVRFGIDQHGELYLLTKGDGWIRKLAPVSETPEGD